MKNKNKKSLTTSTAVIVCVILIATSFSSATMLYSASETRSITNENQSIDGDSSEVLSYKFDFTEPDLQQTTLYGTHFTQVVVHDCQNIGVVGEPALPVRIIRLVLPAKAAVKDIVVSGEALEIDTSEQGANLQESPIIPEQPSRYIKDEDIPEFIQNQEIYASSELYPGNPYFNGGIGDCCGYQILTLYLFPIQYSPASGRIMYYPCLDLSIKTKQTEKISGFYRGLSQDTAKVKAFVDNPEVLDTYGQIACRRPLSSSGLCDPSESCDYVLITSEEIADTHGHEYNWSDLLEHRQIFSGLTTRMVTVETIDSCPAYWNDTALFNDSAAHVREFIKDAYQNWETQYVLLGGDWDVNDGTRQIVPMRVFGVLCDDYYMVPDADEPLFPCDLYFSNLGGTWYWGQYDSGYGIMDIWGGGQNDDVNDPFAEVSVGRLTVDNATQLSNVIKKIIWYDTEADSEFLKKAVFFGGDLGWYEVTSAEYMEEVRLGYDPYFYECIGFAEWNEEHPLFQFNISTRVYYDHGAAVPAEYKQVINSDNACIINHLSHGNPWKSFDMQINELKGLSNSKYFFAYSQQCLSGRFTEGNTTEKILMCDSDDNGAFALVFNTGVGACAPSTNGASQFLQRHFWNYLFDINEQDLSQWILGNAQRYSKDQISAYICYPGLDYHWVIAFYASHLFGDPAQALRLSQPGDNIGVVGLDVRSPVKSDDTLNVNTTLLNNGQYDETNVIVSLLVDDVIVDTITVPIIEKLTTHHVSLQWNTIVGVHNVTVNVTLPGVVETEYTDNELTTTVTAGVQNLNTGDLFNTIQEALDDAQTLDGHMIYVPHGVFHEHVSVMKNIILAGINRESTILEGSGSSESVIQIQNVSHVNITGFTIRNGTQGIYVESSDCVTIFDNDIRGNLLGIHLTDSTSNSIVTWNSVVGNTQGVIIDEESNGNLIYLNSFENTQNALDFCDANQWDNGYLEGFSSRCGNWWSDYNGSDDFSGPDQDEPGSDGIGDTTYTLADGTHHDQYPFIQLFDPAHPVENLDSGARFSSIQEAIDDPNTHNGHTIKVYRNIYYENLVITKSLNLVGVEANTTILDGNGGDQDMIQIAELVDGVKISGFTIRNSTGCGIDIHSDDAFISNNTIYNTHTGIFIETFSCDSLRNTTITNNILHNNVRGITLHGSHGNTICENTIIENSVGIFCNRGSFWGVSNNKIMNNTISRNTYGILFYDLGFEPSEYYTKSIGNAIVHNTICNNEQVGILLWLGKKNHIECNTICENNEGVYLELSSNNTISSNTITGNNEYGISLYQKSLKNKLFENIVLNTNGNGIELNDRCRQNQIVENIIANNNGTGLELFDTCRGNKILKNTIDTNTGHGIRIENAADNNKIYYNNLLSNLEGNAWDTCQNTWYNVESEEGNYWDDFENNSGYPEVYEIPPPEGTNVDLYPLDEPWTPSVPGDTDHDDDVDLADLAQLLGHYGMESGATWEMGDFDGDGDVDLIDLVILLANYGYGTSPIPGDTDHDGDVDLTDLAQLLGHYGMTSGATWEMGDFDGDGDVDLGDLAELLGHYGEGT